MLKNLFKQADSLYDSKEILIFDGDL